MLLYTKFHICSRVSISHHSSRVPISRSFQYQVILIIIFSFFFFLVLPLYGYQPISLHPCTHMLSHVTPWTAAHQAPLSMDFSRQEYWSGLPFPSPYLLYFQICYKCSPPSLYLPSSLFYLALSFSEFPWLFLLTDFLHVNLGISLFSSDILLVSLFGYH